MNTKIVSEKKSEVIVLVLTAMIVAFLASFFASLVYEKIKDLESFNYFFIAALVLLLISSFFIYKLVFSNFSDKRITATVPIAFSRTKENFLDLPNNKLSVQTRVNFNSLPKEGRTHLTTYDKWGHFFNSEFNRFFNQSIQASIINRFLNNWEYETKDKTDFIEKENLVKSIKENPYIKNWIKDKGKIYGPGINKLESFGPNDCYLEIQSKYGTLKFSWSISYAQMASYSNYFFNDKELEPRVDYHDYIVTLRLNYSVNPWRAFSSKSKIFNQWCDYLEMEFNDYDWDSSSLERILLLMKDLKEENNSKKERKTKKKTKKKK
jgi:hypothetical protein